jgi:2-keto-4-pentenoate hydratase/2-oxohepta-3-ene-1,7-dioic acid hydratase in catechol pathway
MRVPVLRDFAAFEDHLQVTFGKMGLKIPREWYERPIAFKGNATSFIGHDEPLKWPQYTQKLDYELELAAVLGLPARDVDVGEAAKHILGYTLLNDFSARDARRQDVDEHRTPRERTSPGVWVPGSSLPMNSARWPVRKCGFW